MSARMKLVIGDASGDIFPLDNRPVPEDGLGHRPSEATRRLRRTLKAAHPGNHFICDLEKRQIYRIASELRVSITMRKRDAGGWHVWVL